MEVSILTSQQYFNMLTPAQYCAPNLTGLCVPFTPKQFGNENQPKLEPDWVWLNDELSSKTLLPKD